MYNCLLSTVKLSTEQCTIVYWALYYCLLKNRGTVLLSTEIKRHWTIVFTLLWALYNCLLSTVLLSTEHCTIVYWALYYCLPIFLSTVKLSSLYFEHCTIVYWALYFCLLSTVQLSSLYLEHCTFIYLGW